MFDALGGSEVQFEKEQAKSKKEKKTKKKKKKSKDKPKEPEIQHVQGNSLFLIERIIGFIVPWSRIQWLCSFISGIVEFKSNIDWLCMYLHEWC